MRVVRSIFRSLRCWLKWCPCISVNVEGGVCSECVDCGKQSHFVSSAEMQAYMEASDAHYASFKEDE